MAKETGELVTLFDRRDDRFFGENLQTGFETDTNMLEMQMVRRTDHQEIEIFRSDDGFRGVEFLSRRNAGAFELRQTGRFRVEVANDFEVGINVP